MELPIKNKEGIVQEPRRMFIFSHPKIGKTSNLMALPNNLLIDLEDGADFYPGMSVNVKRIASEQGKTIFDVLKDVKDSIEAANVKNGKPVYDFITIDTTTILEQLARELGTTLYKNTLIGKAFKGSDVVAELANGSGYEWLRQGFDKIYKGFYPLANKCLILAGHVKLASINKDGKDIQARDVQLTGKLKMAVCSDADAIGFLYRNKETNQNILSFRSSEQDLATGARLQYLSGRDIVISEKKEDGTVVTHWEEIFPSLKVK